jgi:hypothetical protein
MRQDPAISERRHRELEARCRHRPRCAPFLRRGIESFRGGEDVIGREIAAKAAAQATRDEDTAIVEERHRMRRPRLGHRSRR